MKKTVYPQTAGRIFLLLTCTAVTLLAQDPETESTDRILRNIRYSDAETDEPDLLSLDIYPPENAENVPVMIYIHGGGWRRGDKGRIGSKPEFFAGTGWLLVSINYRLIPAVDIVTQVRDNANAVAWVHDHIAEYGGDPEKIHLIGHSAGAHLAALLGTNQEFLGAAGKGLNIVKSVTVLDVPLDIPRVLKTGREVFVQAFGGDPEQWERLSPAHHVEAGKAIPPFLVVMADNIQARLEFSLPFLTAMQEAGIPCTRVDMPDHTHGMVNQSVGVEGDPMTTALDDFLRTVEPGGDAE